MAGVRVEAEYSTLRGSTTTRWRLQWTDGPTKVIMRRLVRAAAREVGIVNPVDVLDYERQGSERAMLAAWALLHEPTVDDRNYTASQARWELSSCHDRVGFPCRAAGEGTPWQSVGPGQGEPLDERLDITTDDPLWELVDIALAATERHPGWSEAADGAVFIAHRGLHGLRMDTWRKHLDDLGPDERPPLPPELPDVTDALIDRLDTALAAIVTHLAGGGASAVDPVARVLAWEKLRELVPRLVDEGQRATVVRAVAGGLPLYRLSQRVGLHTSTLGRRWPSAQFNAALAPPAWMRQHADRWSSACHTLLDQLGGTRGPAATSDYRDVLLALDSTLNRAQDWTGLTSSPDAARALVTAVRADRERRADDPWLAAPAAEPDLDAALAAVEELLLERAAAAPPRRRGGAHPHHDRAL